MITKLQRKCKSNLLFNFFLGKQTPLRPLIGVGSASRLRSLNGILKEPSLHDVKSVRRARIPSLPSEYAFRQELSAIQKDALIRCQTQTTRSFASRFSKDLSENMDGLSTSTTMQRSAKKSSRLKRVSGKAKPGESFTSMSNRSALGNTEKDDGTRNSHLKERILEINKDTPSKSPEQNEPVMTTGRERSKTLDTGILSVKTDTSEKVINNISDSLRHIITRPPKLSRRSHTLRKTVSFDFANIEKMRKAEKEETNMLSESFTETSSLQPPKHSLLALSPSERLFGAISDADRPIISNRRATDSVLNSNFSRMIKEVSEANRLPLAIQPIPEFNAVTSDPGASLQDKTHVSDGSDITTTKFDFNEQSQNEGVAEDDGTRITKGMWKSAFHITQLANATEKEKSDSSVNWSLKELRTLPKYKNKPCMKVEEAERNLSNILNRNRHRTGLAQLKPLVETILVLQCKHLKDRNVIE